MVHVQPKRKPGRPKLSAAEKERRRREREESRAMAEGRAPAPLPPNVKRAPGGAATVGEHRAAVKRAASPVVDEPTTVAYLGGRRSAVADMLRAIAARLDAGRLDELEALELVVELGGRS